MKVALRFFLCLLPVLGITTFGALKVMDHLEHQWLVNDLSRRATLIQGGAQDYLVEAIEGRRLTSAKKLLERISQDERLLGAIVCSDTGKLLARSSQAPHDLKCSDAPGLQATEQDRLVDLGGQELHEAVRALKDDTTTVGYLVLVHDTSYMRARHALTRRYVLTLLIGLGVFFFALTLAVYRWSISRSLQSLKEAFRGMLAGNPQSLSASLRKTEFFPLVRDLNKVIKQLRAEKESAPDADNAFSWTPARLRSELRKNFGDSQLCVIANREPYIHNRKGNQVEVLFPASGLVTAVEPIVRACSGLWIAHGSGSADRQNSDRDGKLLVPPGKPEYALKRVWLSKAEEEGYYYGFSNEGLWPLCHIAHTRPHFSSEDWKHYTSVNEKFAQAFFEEEHGESPIVLIQDYHFALLPRIIRNRQPRANLSLFWHIPWPNPEAFGICPWKKELLIGMLGSDLIGFHTQFHCNNFLDTVDRFLEARVDRENFSVTFRGHTTYVKPFPISVEWPARHDIPVGEFAAEREQLLSELDLPASTRIGLGVDRVDYTKGIVERFQAIERLLELHPEYVGKFSFVQIGAPSRTHIKRYQDLNSEVQELADRINWKFASAEVPPIILKLSHCNSPDLYRYYRAANVCFVSSLHDGMNLVAKEYVSARSDSRGALVLSHFAGASRELGDAIVVNPYAIDECAQALDRALTMPVEEQIRRMERMRKTVSEQNVYAWAGSYLGEIHRLSSARAAQESVTGAVPHWYAGALNRG